MQSTMFKAHSRLRFRGAVDKGTRGGFQAGSRFPLPQAGEVVRASIAKPSITPAMAAGVSDKLWTLTELVEQTSR